MKKFKFTLIIAIISITLISCFNRHWSAEQRKEFDTKCSQTDTFNNIVFQFRGFDNNEFDTIVVKDYKDTVLVDSFKVFVGPAQYPYEKERKERYATIDRTMNVKHKYHFIIPGQRPYELANMKMIMWAQYTMTSEGWGCVMGTYTIDGLRFEHDANPTFIKRDSNNTK